jgi:hypothetical protein
MEKQVASRLRENAELCHELARRDTRDALAAAPRLSAAVR